MNFKRKKCRRRGRCILCTPYRGLGNTKQRRPPRETALRRELDREVRDSF